MRSTSASHPFVLRGDPLFVVVTEARGMAARSVAVSVNGFGTAPLTAIDGAPCCAATGAAVTASDTTIDAASIRSLVP
ncbi:MAG: hypothetical protein IPG88_20750 [Gemmatimonadetes bacterium]|nr:hypothetical protein [Gemmatimonadota bacterium]